MVRAIVIVSAILIVGIINAVELDPRTSGWPWNQHNYIFHCNLPNLDGSSDSSNEGVCVAFDKCVVPGRIKNDEDMKQWKMDARCGKLENSEEYKYCCDEYDSTLEDIETSAGPHDNSPIFAVNEEKEIRHVILTLDEYDRLAKEASC